MANVGPARDVVVGRVGCKQDVSEWRKRNQPSLQSFHLARPVPLKDSDPYSGKAARKHQTFQAHGLRYRNGVQQVENGLVMYRETLVEPE